MAPWPANCAIITLCASYPWRQRYFELKLRANDNVLVTKDGCEMLSSFPRDIIAI